ncbi:alpha-L-fucosidase [Nilaparvata lugens]|uniref:alpha-L-fucosidase n=1 Tax=Nilaparvata lugens TaxID=108931 RepID=UPI00193E7B1F|nr:alpha-L-fucosidase [Nilaparvata lugens]
MAHTGILFSLCIFFIFAVSRIEGKTKYEPNWESLDSRPIPNWYEDAKIGIFIHWGVFSVPSFATEWFWKNWKSNRADISQFMKKNYPPNFSYQDFAAQFTGEHFNATKWAEIFQNSGAQYIIFTSKHHEGYAMWPSRYSFSWNSMDVGLKRDIIGELSEAIRKNTNLHFGLYHSLYEWFNPMYLADRASNFSTQTFVDQKIIPEMRELVFKYRPEVIWSDGEWEAADTYWRSLEFIAWLYNSSPVKDTVVVNDRWGSKTLCKHGGFLTCSDRYNPGKLQSRKWENAFTLDKESWGYRREANLEDYMTIGEIINLIVEAISCNGNVALNVGPTKEGTISPIYQDRLASLGKWLKVTGPAIYKSRPWLQCQNDTLTSNVWYTSKPGKGNPEIFAIVLFWPKDGYIDLGCLHSKNVVRVSMFGVDNCCGFETRGNGLRVIFPNKAETSNDWAWALSISYSDTSDQEPRYETQTEL